MTSGEVRRPPLQLANELVVRHPETLPSQTSRGGDAEKELNAL
jgi:hypothetical protein